MIDEDTVAFQSVLDNIDYLIGRLTEPTDASFKEEVLAIQKLVVAAKDGNPATVAKALQYIEKMQLKNDGGSTVTVQNYKISKDETVLKTPPASPFQSLFSSFSMRRSASFRDDKTKNLPNHLMSQEQYGKVDYFYTELLKYHEYLTLLEKSKARIVWSFDFPLVEEKNPKFREKLSEKEVMFLGVKEWQEKVLVPANDKNSAIVDINRNYSLLGKLKNSPSKEEIEKLIDNFVDMTQYEVNEKELLKLWLREKGGQIMNGICRELFNNSTFSVNPFDVFDSSTKETHWHIEDGKIVFNLDMIISSIIDLDTGDAILAPENSKDYVRCPQDSLTTYYPVSKQERVSGFPLLRMQAKISLAVAYDKDDNKIIIPKVQKLSTTSYTHFLNNPKHLFVKNEEITVVHPQPGKAEMETIKGVDNADDLSDFVDIESEAQHRERELATNNYLRSILLSIYQNLEKFELNSGKNVFEMFLHRMCAFVIEIQGAEESKKTALLRTAIQYLENVTIVQERRSGSVRSFSFLNDAISYMTSSSLLDELQKDGSQKTLPKLSPNELSLEIKSKDDYSIPKTYLPILIEMHANLINYYDVLLFTARNEIWKGEYRLNEISDNDKNESEVKIPDKTFKRWETSLSTLTGKKCLGDYLRDTYFPGVEAARKLSDLERVGAVSELIDKFVEKAIGYDEQEKKLIAEWMKEIGGSQLDTIFNFLLEDCHFNDASHQIMNTKTVGRRFLIENNKIYIETEFLLYSAIHSKTSQIAYLNSEITNKNTRFSNLSNSNDQTLDAISLYPNLHEDELMETPNLDKEALDPLMRFTAKIELTTKELGGKTQVRPKIRELEVFSYSGYFYPNVAIMDKLKLTMKHSNSLKEEISSQPQEIYSPRKLSF